MAIFPDFWKIKRYFFDGNRFKFYEFALFLYEEYHGCYIDNRPHVLQARSTSHLI